MRKHPARSKTLWFNALAFLVMALPLVQTWAGATALTLPLWVSEVLALVIPIANLGLRFVTQEPLGLEREGE